MEVVLEFLQEVRAFLSDLNVITMVIRVLLAAIAGGLVGLEREFHGRAAGMRTHMLVCLGAALSALIGAFLCIEMGLSSDAQRTGAQVMSGVGFLGAGTILVKKGNSRVSGLTTAAGLWATAAIGLAVGYGLYEAAFVTVFMVMIAFTVVSKMEFRLTRKRQRMFVYLEIDRVESVQEMMETLTQKFGGVEIQVTPPRSGIAPHVGMEALIRLPSKGTVEGKMKKLNALEHVIYALQGI
ncbi:MAG: MgtC/SapB family protein [Clostridia bacterium]|nr:MgtC/SapB family protein [Clostridia bacterium]